MKPGDKISFYVAHFPSLAPNGTEYKHVLNELEDVDLFIQNYCDSDPFTIYRVEATIEVTEAGYTWPDPELHGDESHVH